MLTLAAFWIPESPVRNWVLWPTVAVMWALLVSFVWHVNALCVICAGMTELDGNAAAARYDHDLRRFHRSIRLGVALAAQFAVLIASLVFHLPPVVNQIASTVVGLYTGLSLRAWNRHRLLEPWCRYCDRRRRWDEGGPREPSPRPDPATETTPLHT